MHRILPFRVAAVLGALVLGVFAVGCNDLTQPSSFRVVKEKAPAAAASTPKPTGVLDVGDGHEGHGHDAPKPGAAAMAPPKATGVKTANVNVAAPPPMPAAGSCGE
jgi:hypothetical protein